MKNTKVLLGACFAALLSMGALTGCFGGNKSGKDKYDKDGRLILELKNVYFDQWAGGDIYTEELNEKFGVNIKPSNYDYTSWDEMVNTAINANNIKDVIHFNLKAYNFGTTYEKWADQMIIKALPDNMSKWPNIQKMLSHVSNIDALKINGKLYGIPIMNDTVNYEKDFSNFTYIYRRDWAKEIDAKNAGKTGYVPVYKEGDVYTWDEFKRLLAAFKANPKDNKSTVMVDEKWGFPSVTNLFKNAPHCFDKDSNGKAICAFTSDKYVEGLEVAKQFVTDKYYSADQYNFSDGKANELYRGGQAAILYDNFSYANYSKLRYQMRKEANLDDATALLKVKGPDGHFGYEGTENWFSMTMFNYDISDTKMNKILDIMDYLLSEEGTRFAIYGKEGYDYSIVNGEIVLSEKGWEKDSYGNYVAKNNGARYLRFMCSLGNETKSFDPTTDQASYKLINDWYTEMKAAKDANNLRVVKEPSDISWMSTKEKNDKTQGLLEDSNVTVLKYAFNKIGNIDDYKKAFTSNGNWKKVLDEINAKLGF